MIKGVFFDMDGTLADLYNSSNWLEKLRGEKAGVYDYLQAIPDMEIVSILCRELQKNGISVNVISWLGMNASMPYKKLTRGEKRFWLKSYNMVIDHCHIVSYGAKKHHIAKRHYELSECVLFDDNVDVVNDWIDHGGEAVLVRDGEDVIRGLRAILQQKA